MKISAGTIINFLLNSFMTAAVKYDTGEKLTPMENWLISIISDNYCEIYSIYSNEQISIL